MWTVSEDTLSQRVLQLSQICGVIQKLGVRAMTVEKF